MTPRDGRIKKGGGGKNGSRAGLSGPCKFNSLQWLTDTSGHSREGLPALVGQSTTKGPARDHCVAKLRLSPFSQRRTDSPGEKFQKILLRDSQNKKRIARIHATRNIHSNVHILVLLLTNASAKPNYKLSRQRCFAVMHCCFGGTNGMLGLWARRPEHSFDLTSWIRRGLRFCLSFFSIKSVAGRPVFLP